MVEAVNDPVERRRRGELARGEAVSKYSWREIGETIAATLGEVIKYRSPVT